MPNIRKFLDANGLTYFASKLDNYPTNEVLGTVINAIDDEIDEKEDKNLHYAVILNNDGTINTYDNNLTYNNLINKNVEKYLDITFDTISCQAKAIQIFNNNSIFFIGFYTAIDGTIRVIIFTLTDQDILSVNHVFLEVWNNKVQSVINNASNTLTYPSTKAIYDEFQRKPVIIYETNSTGLTAIDADLTENNISWQLTNLDFSPYKRVKIYTKAGKKTSGVGTDASNTPAVILEMSLDSRAASPVGGHYCGSYVGQKPNDANRLFTVTCAISSDKTKFAVLRMSSLYGTAATANSDVNGYVFKIEGYYD